MIHGTAIIEAGARLGAGVVVGPYTVIGPKVILGDGVRVGAHVVIEGNTAIGDETQIYPGAVIGQPPQHLHYRGEPTRVAIGMRCQIREFVSIHRGTEAGGGLTHIGDDCMIMAYSHVAHDCRVGDQVVMANGATLAGHVEIQDFANIGGLTAIHQFARIGRNAFVGGASAVSMDILPFASAAGNRAEITGVNVIGMRRTGFSEEAIKIVRQAHRIIFRSNRRLEEAVEELEQQFPASIEVQLILEFVQASQRGICR